MRKVWLLLGIVFLVGCSQPAPTPIAPDVVRPVSTPGTLPPTFTPEATAVPPVPSAPQSTSTPAATATSVDFDKTSIQLRYTIPLLGLDRRLRGNIGGQIFLLDGATGAAEEYNNQPTVLAELQTVLPQTELLPVPDGCDACVQLEYQLPLTGESGSGWVQDTVLLVSLDNFMTAALGSHFPPGTQTGLRRNISQYAPAHTLAVTGDGRLFRWLAVDNQIAEPVPADPALLVLAQTVPVADLASDYIVDCAVTLPVETLIVSPDAAPIQLACPEFGLPGSLLPLYLAFDDLLAPILADLSVPRPPAAFPLRALLDYHRADETRLTIYQDGLVTAVTATETYTSTLGATQIVSLTTTLLDSGQLQPGLKSFLPTPTPVVTATAVAEPMSTLVLRGPDRVYDGRWPGIPDLTELNALLDSLLPLDVPEPGATAVP
ncbi:MAG: hypothetical protein H6667_26325 [Ardenticatenaceae bacterium]|nr:hypothetical protein [Ardenticatenaceae bacterium]